MRALKFAGLLLATLLVLTLVPSAPSAGAPAARVSPNAMLSASAPSYVAMGSSFAAGPGIAPLEADSPAACGRSAANYANLVAARLGYRLTDVSCLGATTANILTARQNGLPPEIGAVGSKTRLVTVTIGGNDVDYFGSLAAYSCRDAGGRACHAVNVGAISRALATLKQRLENVVEAIHARAPRARVLLVNYFTVLSPHGLCAGTPLSAGHAAFERSLAATLAADTASAAHGTGATLVDLAAAGAAHSACSAQPWVNTFRPGPGLWSYHPTPAGMAGAAQLIERALRAPARIPPARFPS